MMKKIQRFGGAMLAPVMLFSFLVSLLVFLYFFPIKRSWEILLRLIHSGISSGML